MVTSDIFVNAPAAAFYTVKILSKKAENIVAAIFTLYCEYFVVFLTQATIKTIKILVFNIFFLKQKPVTVTHQNFVRFFRLDKKKLIVHIFPPKINTV